MRTGWKLPLLLLTTIGLLIFPSFSFAKSYSDVPSYHKNYEAITELSNIGMLEGYQDGLFKPERTISREEAVKLIVLGTRSEARFNGVVSDLYNQYVQTPFPDVPANRWSAPHITLGYQEGIIHGYPDGTFQPKKTINFVEGLKVVLEAYNANLNEYPYRDIDLIHMDSEDWYAPYFTYAYQKNLINQQKYHHPKFEMTRGEFAEIIYRMETIQNNQLNQYQSVRQPYSSDYTITIPRLNVINLKVSFADIYDSTQALNILKDGLGHYLSPPNSEGKMVLFGHSSGYSWDTSAYKQVLRQINQLQNGDRIYINFQEKGYVYEISGHEVMPASQLPKIIEDNHRPEKLSLYTCWPPDSISHRYVIYANEIKR